MDGGPAKVPSIGESALEDVLEGTFGHGIVRDTAGFGTLSKDRSFQGRIVESLNQLVFTLRDLLLADVLEIIKAKEGVIGNRHSEEETGILIEKLFVFLRCRPKSGRSVAISSWKMHCRDAGERGVGIGSKDDLHDVFWITVILHPALVDLVDESPATTVYTL